MRRAAALAALALGSSIGLLAQSTLPAQDQSQPAQVFTASGTTQTVIVDIDPQNVPARFFVVDETP